ncbi:MAG: hypothetical protein QM737_22725 [Ferruginibacter sp.]
MKKLIAVTAILMSLLSCKKDKPDQNNNCGTIASRIVHDCDVNGCNISIAVDYPDGRSEAYSKFVPLNSTEYSIGSTYCK